MRSPAEPRCSTRQRAAGAAAVVVATTLATMAQAQTEVRGTTPSGAAPAVSLTWSQARAEPQQQQQLRLQLQLQLQPQQQPQPHVQVQAQARGEQSPQAVRLGPRARLDVDAVETAASAVRADPTLGGTKTERTWRFKKTDTPPPTPPSPFLIELARWFAEGGRWAMWLLGATLLAVAIVAARRWLAVRGEAVRAPGARLPSHVRELDIRPESLPDDIGAAVRALWLAGQRRAALSLLYRGTLSRLVHTFAVAIGDASTEGDCIRLARAALPAEQADFVAALVGAWQLAVYGDRPLETAQVLGLCAEFDRMLPAAPTSATRSAMTSAPPALAGER